MPIEQTTNQKIPQLGTTFSWQQIGEYSRSLAQMLEGQIVQSFTDLADFNARVPVPKEPMLVVLSNPTPTLNIYMGNKLNQVWPALPAWEYGTEPPTHVAPYGTLYVQT